MALFTSELTPREMVPLCRQLSTSYRAGIPLLRGFEITARGISSKKIRDMLDRMQAAIRNGSTLHQAARAETGLLPEFAIEILGAGEVGGRLDVMLQDMAEYYEDLSNIQRTVYASMVYPGLQLTAAWFLGTFALGISGRFGSMTQGGFNLGTYFREYALFQGRALAVFALAFVIAVLLARAGLFGHISGFFKTFIWPLRPISRRFGLARFFRGMSLLIGAGLNLRDCIRRSAALTLNPYMTRDLLKSIPVVMSGGTLVEAFSHCTTLSPVAREMIAIGEQSGDLDGSLRRVADWHLEEARAAVRVGITVMGILVLLFVGGVVGYVVISFYSGYFSMLDAF